MNFILATNQKPRIHAHPKQRNSNITLDIVIKSQKKKGRKISTKNKFKTINKMAIRIHILIITLNINGINAPTKDIDWLNGYKSRTHIYAAYKRPT